jgi:pyruvate carboxylase subunit B
MKEEGWDRGQDDEELFEFAMHERQYRDYKSGIAKKRFETDLEAAKAKAGAPIIVTRPVVEMPKFDIDALVAKFPNAKPIQSPVKGKVIWQYDVADVSTAPNIGTEFKQDKPVCYVEAYFGPTEVPAPITGRIVAITAKQGDMVEKGEILGFIE